MRVDVGLLGLVLSFALVAVAAALSALQHLRLEREIVWAALRAVVQLLAVGGLLGFVIAPDAPLALAWLWVVAMIGVAADVVARRTPEVPRVRSIAVLAFAAAGAVTLGVIFGLEIFPIEGRTVVPLAGMMLGNSMGATVLATRRVVEELRDKRDEVEARLALGHPSRTAAGPYVSAALRIALLPHVESTKTVGLVSLPGAMTGLILAGVPPLQAVLVQTVVMFLVLAAVATTSSVVALRLLRLLFTPDHRLTPLVRPAD